MKVLMVCLGNICRSPLAEGILRNEAHKLELDVEVDSCGTAGYHIGEKPDTRSIAKAKEYGIDITDLRGRQFDPEDFSRFDHILVMDQSNFDNIISIAETKSEKEKVKMILEYTFPGENREVPDPYYGALDGFEQVYQLLKESIAQFIEKEYQS